MIAVLINTLTVIVGSSVGLLLRNSFLKRVSNAVMCAIGLCVIYIGVDNALEGSNALITVVAMVVGCFIGSLIKIDDRFNSLSKKIENKFAKKEGVNFAEGFIAASLVFCVGAMTIIGSLNAGLNNDNELLITKSIMDLISSCILASVLGFGVLLASVTVLVYQGALVLLAGLLKKVLTDTLLVGEITCVGGVLMIALGLNLVGVTKIKLLDLLPAILVVVPAYFLISLIGG